MRKITIQKMGKIAAVSVMSAIISISFNGCWFFGSSTDEIKKIKAESCNGKGVVTIRGDNIIAKGECKNGLKEGLWKYYSTYDSSKLIGEDTFANGLLNGVTKTNVKTILDSAIGGYVSFYATIKYYNNGKKIYYKERDYNRDKYLYLYEEDIKTSTEEFIRWRKYDIDYKRAYDSKVEEIEQQNRQIERENGEIQWKYNEAKEQAQVIAQKRAESKVKKPTMQEVKKSKNAMDTYRAKLQAQVEKELQIELSKIQSPQVTQKQTIEIPQYKEPKLDTYEEVLAFVKDKKYIIEESYSYYGDDYNYKGEINISQDSDGNNFEGKIRANNIYCTIENDRYRGNGCEHILRHYTLFWDKTMFKDKLKAILLMTNR